MSIVVHSEVSAGIAGESLVSAAPLSKTTTTKKKKHEQDCFSRMVLGMSVKCPKIPVFALWK